MANQESLDARVRTNQPELWLVGRAERPTERCDVHAIKLTEDELERANIGINLAVLPEYIAIKGVLLVRLWRLWCMVGKLSMSRETLIS